MGDARGSTVVLRDADRLAVAFEDATGGIEPGVRLVKERRTLE